MQLSLAQLQALKADLATNFPSATDQAAADAYNVAASPDFYVWRSAVTEEEFVATAGVDVANGGAATTFNWTGTGYIGRTQGERDAWARIFLGGDCNPSLANVRQAFSDILSGSTSPAPANRNHMLVLSKRKATRGEKLLSAGTGTFASPANMGVGAEGPVTATNVSEARNS